MKFFVILEGNRVTNLFNREDDNCPPAAENIKEVEEKLFYDLLQVCAIQNVDVFLDGGIVKVVSKSENEYSGRFLCSYFDMPEYRALTGINVIDSRTEYNRDLYVEVSEEVYNFIKENMFEANSGSIKVDKGLVYIGSVDQINMKDMKLSPEDKFEMEKHMLVEKKSGELFSGVSDKTLMNFFNFIVRNNELMANGIFITDENRDEQYLKILRDAASEDESVKIAAEKRIDILSDYLEAYDSLNNHFAIHKLFKKFKKEVLDCENYEEIEKVVKKYEEQYFSTRR